MLDEKYGRRDFLRSLGRYLMLGGLVCAGGILAVKSRSAASEGKSVDIGVCRSCLILNTCDKPTALLAKEEMAR